MKSVNKEEKRELIQNETNAPGGFGESVMMSTFVRMFIIHYTINGFINLKGTANFQSYRWRL